nr:hypothetical protein [Ardenticatena sp.]
MSPYLRDDERFQHGRRDAIEWLVGNEALRRHLTDEEARPLLAWAQHVIDDVVRRTLRLPDEDAAARIEETLDALGALLRTINRLLAPDAPSDDAIARLADAAARLGLPTPPALPSNREAMLDTLMAWLEEETRTTGVDDV